MLEILNAEEQEELLKGLRKYVPEIYLIRGAMSECNDNHPILAPSRLIILCSTSSFTNIPFIKTCVQLLSGGSR